MESPAAASGATIRPAVGIDASALAEIDRRTGANPRSVRQYEVCCREGGAERALVFEADGRIEGFVAYSTVLDEGSINTVAVAPERQGRGVGRALLCAAFEVMRKEGAVRCLLEVSASNVVALGLYRALGFVVDGRRAGYYRTESGPEDALLMSKPL